MLVGGGVDSRLDLARGSHRLLTDGLIGCRPRTPSRLGRGAATAQVLRRAVATTLVGPYGEGFAGLGANSGKYRNAIRS